MADNRTERLNAALDGGYRIERELGVYGPCAGAMREVWPRP